MGMTRHGRLARAATTVVLAAAVLAACGPRANPVLAPQQSEAEKAGYLTAPDILAVVAAAGVVLARPRLAVGLCLDVFVEDVVVGDVPEDALLPFVWFCQRCRP